MNNPKLIPAPFAINGQKNSIPDRFSSEMPSNTATWDQGFPPITTIPATAGGLPPIGQDFNGIFNQVSENIVFLAEGGRYKFSEEHATSIGGYKQGAILQSDDNLSEYQSLIDGNLINFNTAPEMEVSAAWKKISPLTLSELPATVTPLDNDLMLINHSGADQSITAQKLSDYFNSKLPLSSDIDSTSETTAATSKAVSDALATLGTAAKRNVGTGTNQVPDMDSFTSGSNWFKFPNGMIIQRGVSISGPQGFPTTINLPIPFTQGGFVITTSFDTASNTSTDCPSFAATPIGLTAFYLMSSRVSAGTGAGANWIAIGK